VEFIPLLGDDEPGLYLTRAANRTGLLRGSASDAAEMIWDPGHAKVVHITMHAPCQDYFAARRICAHGGDIMTALTDSTTTVAELKARVLAFARERDWEQFHAPKNLSMALAAEAGELMEHFLWATPEASRAVVLDPEKRQKISEELADVVIYALEFANVTGLDVAAAIQEKMLANAQKYPVEKARGRAEKYTEL
jgi:dCTP diphosphatase